MKIAVDLRRIENPGIGRYMKNLFQTICRLDQHNEYLLIVPPGYDGFRPDSKHVQVVPDGSKYYSFREQWVLPRLLAREAVELFHSPHFLLPWHCPCPSVVTIHDVIYLVFKQDLPSFIGRQYYRFQIGFSGQHSDAIITASEFSRTEIVKHLGVPADKIRVIYSAPDPQFQNIDSRQAEAHVAERFGIRPPFLFNVGLQFQRKNLQRLLGAFAQLGERRKGFQLILAGPFGPIKGQLESLVARKNLQKAVRFLGPVTDFDLVALYNSAMALVFPSLYEGFGFPVVEAFACGTPVITSNISSLPELAGDAALLVDPTNVEEIREAMDRVIGDEGLRRSLIQKGFAQVQKFTWDRTAQQTLDVYQQVLN